MYQLLTGDCVDVMRTLPTGSVHCVVTSPPYFGLRDYGVDGQIGLESAPDCLAWARNEPPCGKCYVCTMRAVFAEVWRVLRDDGVAWLNLGDSFASSTKGSGGGWALDPRNYAYRAQAYGARKFEMGDAKPKDLMLIPHRVALALQTDGWYLRMDAIWAKRNCMPESVTDRPTKAHEYVFLLAKSQRYFYDADAVREASVYPDDNRKARQNITDYQAMMSENGQVRSVINPANAKTYPARNLRSVFHLSNTSYGGAHFATMPPALAEICVKAGSSERGVCAECGAPWERVVDKEWVKHPNGLGNGTSAFIMGGSNVNRTTGWQPTCTCNAVIVPATVLDPFNGSGTTGAVACSLGRHYVGIDLNPDYIEMSHTRIRKAINQSGVAYMQPVDEQDYSDMPLFRGDY